MDQTIETKVNEILLRNGWDYDERKRVLFMLRNRKLPEHELTFHSPSPLPTRQGERH